MKIFISPLSRYQIPITTKEKDKDKEKGKDKNSNSRYRKSKNGENLILKSSSSSYGNKIFLLGPQVLHVFGKAQAHMSSPGRKCNLGQPCLNSVSCLSRIVKSVWNFDGLRAQGSYFQYRLNNELFKLIFFWAMGVRLTHGTHLVGWIEFLEIIRNVFLKVAQSINNLSIEEN